jgi:hypothetical protein
MESPRERKIREAREFFGKIKVDNFMFIGISGSVSYEPREEDDIDIFLISKRGKLWISIVEILLFRRAFGFRDLCLSLSMDESYAFSFFAQLKEGLAAKDSKRVVPIKGEEYFNRLLKVSSVISGETDGNNALWKVKTREGRHLGSLLDLIPFLFVSSWINIRALYSNHRDRKDGRGGFKTIFSLHKFYFDTDKYHKLNDLYLRGAILNEENSSDI